VKLVGLTGGIASGKSTVAAILRRLGAEVINADELAREVVEPGRDAWQEIIAAFGSGVLQDDRAIDRRKLREVIFKDAAARQKLEAIIHPRVRALAEQKIRACEAAGKALVVYEVPLLFEALIHHWIRPVILVACDMETQKARLKQRDHLSDAEAHRHIEAQMSLAEKRKLADYVIENDGSLEDLEAQVKAVIEKIKAT
jgi:dephospho-CoA kinase